MPSSSGSKSYHLATVDRYSSDQAIEYHRSSCLTNAELPMSSLVQAIDANQAGWTSPRRPFRYVPPKPWPMCVPRQNGFLQSIHTSLCKPHLVDANSQLHARYRSQVLLHGSEYYSSLFDRPCRGVYTIDHGMRYECSPLPAAGPSLSCEVMNKKIRQMFI